MKKTEYDLTRLPTPKSDSLTIIPLGGTDRVGMNCTLVGHAGRWIMIDAGATFAGSDDDAAAAFGERHGGVIQQIVPDLRAIAPIMDKLDGIVITHAHEDHIGALQTLFSHAKSWPRLLQTPIYAGDYARGIIRRKLEEVGHRPNIKRIASRRMARIGGFDVTPIGVTHSAPETFMFAIRSPVGTIVFGSDYKLDPEPLVGRTTDLKAMSALGDKGVLAYLGDSTNARHEGRSTSEGSVSRNLEKIMRQHKGRVVISTFASNLARVVGVAQAAKASGRQLAAAGRTIFNNVETGIATGLVPAKALAFADNWVLNGQPRHKAAIVCTGTQAEQGSALRRAAEDLELGRSSRRGILLEPGDLVIHSARIIPGNEATVEAMLDILRQHGVQVMTANDAPIHASGHAKRQEIEEVYRRLRPRFAAPVHGDRALIAAHAEIAESAAGVERVISPREGEILEIFPDSMTITGSIDVGQLALLSLGERHSGETRLMAWDGAPKFDVRRSQSQARPPRRDTSRREVKVEIKASKAAASALAQPAPRSRRGGA